MPSLSSVLGAGLRPLKATLASNSAADEDDVVSVKTSLKRLGYYEEPDYGLTPYPDRPLFTAIRSFQKDNDLDVDGVMKPAGPTELKLAEALKQKAAAPTQPLYVVPAYRKDVFKGPRQTELNTWVKIVNDDPAIPRNLKKSFHDIYVAEGGMKQDPEGSAYAGILQDTLTKFYDQNLIQSVKKKYVTRIPKPFELNAEDIREVYKAYFNDTMKGAVKGYNKDKNPEQYKNGLQLLDDLKDEKGAAAVANVLFRHGSDKGAKYIQESINSALSKEDQIPTYGGMGSQTYNGLRKVLSDKSARRVFLNNLKNKNIAADEEKRELDRINYFYKE